MSATARAAHWNGQSLSFAPGVARSAAPSGDQLERLWQTYYAHIFNPARFSSIISAHTHGPRLLLRYPYMGG